MYLAFGFSSCSRNCDQSCQIQKPLNPNGDSELALLMRAMFDDGMRMKQQIESGKVPKVVKHFDKMLTAKATQPEKVANPRYKAYADVYLNFMNELEHADKESAVPLYKSMVQSCLNCHSILCPGPKVRIEKLVLEN